VIVIDTSFVYALIDRRDQRHAEAASWYRGIDEELATTPLVVAEIDHLVATRAGEAALKAFRRDLVAGAYLVDWWATAASEIVATAERYAEIGLSLADASLVALAARHETAKVATFDERHFRVVRPLEGPAAFTLLPADAG
jgi:predicted nucleic acid-binding protein